MRISLTTTDSSISSDGDSEPEEQIDEKPTDSTGKEAEEICVEFTEPRKDDKICEDSVGELGKKAEISENVIRPENEIEVGEHIVEPREGDGIFEKCNESRNGTDICEEVVVEDKLVNSCEKGKGKEIETESENSEKHWNGDLNTAVQHLCSEMEVQRVLTTTDPATSPNNYIEPIESAGNEAEISMEATGPGKEAEVDAFEKGKGKEIEICEEEVVEAAGNEGQTLNHPFLESDMPQNSRLSSLRHVPFYERGESSSLPEQQSEKPEETTPPHFNTHEEQTGAGSLASQASTCPETSHPQQKDVQGLRGTKDSISLLSEFLHILQTQPLNSMRSEQFQFIEDAFRDLSNISIDWFSPYVEKAREFSLVVDRSKKISEIEAQLQALKEEKRALEEKNEAVASCVDLDKPLLDN